MTLRRATAEDKAAVVRMGLEFFKASPYAAILPGANEEGLARLVEFVIAPSPTMLALLAVDDVDAPIGMLGMHVSPHPLNGQPYAEELVWWVEPGHRGARLAGPLLLEAGEAWAREAGAKLVKMIAPSDRERVGQFYERVGYQEIETCYVKVL